MNTEDFEELFGKKCTIKFVRGVGYDRTAEGYTFVIVSKSKEYYVTSQTPMELDVRDIH